MHELLQVAERSIVTLLDLPQLVVVGQIEQRPLHNIHLLHFAQDILPDAVHYFLGANMYMFNETEFP